MKEKIIVWMFLLQAGNKNWFVRFLRGTKLMHNSEQYESKTAAAKVIASWIRVDPAVFKDGTQEPSRAVPYDITQLPEWQATHPQTPYQQSQNHTVC